MIDHNKLYEQLKDKSLLFIEDYAPLRKVIASSLGDYCSKVVHAADGEEGINIYKAQAQQHHAFFDIVITDINMPKKNGLEISREIRALNPNQNIIVISADNDRSNLIGFINLGVNHFIAKPVNMIELLQVLDTLTSKAVANQTL